MSTRIAADLKARWDDLLSQEPHLRIRNAAARLGVSEAELLATGCGQNVTRLDGGWGALLTEVESLGEVMALTRGDACVHEKTGIYHDVRLMESHEMGLVVDEQIDLRLFFSRWHLGFATETLWKGAKDDIRRSLQFFDRDGTAVHKVFLTRKSDVAAYERLVEKYRHDDQSAGAEVEPRAAAEPERPDAEVDAPLFLQAWGELKDTHDFFPMIREHEVSCTQALRLAEGTFTERADTSAAREALERAARAKTPIMIFAYSPGCIQIHGGPVKQLKATPPWFNVLDPGFQLHLNEELIDSAWVVRKPTRDGTVTSLELFDADGEVIALFFGKRKPGQPELEAWRDIVAELPRLELASAA